MKNFRLFTVAILFTVTCVASPAQDLFISNARIFALGETDVIESGNILIQDGKIAAVGDITAPDGIKTIDATGMQITPGLVNSHTHLGLTEISLVKHTVDVATEDEQFSAAFAIDRALNPDSTLIPQNRLHGITHAIIAPDCG